MVKTIGIILKLMRWQEFVPFTTILTWLGGLLAHRVYGATLDWRLFAAMVGNLGAVGYAFMINEIEDAPDDAHDVRRSHKNVIVTGELSVYTAWLAAVIVAMITVIAYAVCGTIPFILGMVTLTLAHLYSWKPVRLKARPLIDIFSHALFLSTLLFLIPFYIYANHLGKLWVVALGTFFISANGQFYNQERDFAADRLAGLHNTASVIGKWLTGLLAIATIVGSVLCLIVAVLQDMFPLWLGGVVVISAPVVILLMWGNTKDMRGDETADRLGQIQIQFLAIANITLLVWLGQVLIS